MDEPVQKRAYRKTRKDNISGLRNPQILRLAHKAGVKSMSSTCYNEIRDITKYSMENIIRAAILQTRHRRAKTVSLEDMLAGIRIATRKNYAYTKATTKHIKKC
jgi:histone H3/H4